MKLPIKTILIVFAVIVGLSMLFTIPVVATDDGDIGENLLCGEDAGSDDAAETVRTIFLILAALGPVLGTLFWVALSVAEAASVNKDKSKQKRKVIVAGFSVPLAIAFANAIASEIVGVDVDCFFPDMG